MTRLLKPVLTLCVAASIAAGPALAAQSCVPTRDIRNISTVDAHTALVKMRTDEVYRVTFANACQTIRARTYFIINEPWMLGECLREGTALPTNGMGSCFIKSVSPADKTTG